MSILPAAWKPITIEGPVASQATVTTQGGLIPRTSLSADTEYTVTSRLPLWTPAQLRRAGTAYPAEIDETYREVPADTGNRVTQRTNQIIANASADTPYDAAIAVERYLEADKQYSLSVSKPDGNVAESFLFEMDAGYCVYYASTMAVMLRTQGIPTRFVTGYTPGQRIDSNTHVVRGLNSHAWVEVYFPDTGWVRFDPTPRLRGVQLRIHGSQKHVNKIPRGLISMGQLQHQPRILAMTRQKVVIQLMILGRPKRRLDNQRRHQREQRRMATQRTQWLKHQELVFDPVILSEHHHQHQPLSRFSQRFESVGYSLS
jgi:Transglutaminase-like enzymes, putative cysteine proteases